MSRQTDPSLGHSAVRSWTADRWTAPGVVVVPPRLLGPHRGLTINVPIGDELYPDAFPTLRWLSVPGATTYRVYVGVEVHGLAPLGRETTELMVPAGGDAVLALPFDPDLVPAGTIGGWTRVFWSVTACNADDVCAAGVGPEWYFDVGRQRSDFDGDSLADIAVGAPGASQVHVFLSTAAPDSPEVFRDDSCGGDFGLSLAADDTDGDGRAELFIGAPGCGFVFRITDIVPGGGSVEVIDRAMFGLPDTESGFGQTVAAVGDLNGDGNGQIAISAGSSGRIVLFPSTGDSSVIDPPAGAVNFGARITGGSDMDHDGYPDLIVSDQASAWIITREGSQTVIGRGPLVAGLGDFTGNGIGDVAVGSELGEALVWGRRVPDGPYEFSESVPGAGDIRSLAPAGDVNADGFTDVLVGIPMAATGVGEVWIAYGHGPMAASLAPTRLVDASGGATEFGAAVAGGGDVDGNGRADVVVGSPATDVAILYFDPVDGAAGTLLFPPAGEPAGLFGSALEMGRP